MRPYYHWIRFLLLLSLVCYPVSASDHADPMSVVNPFKQQDDPLANITDLHAFVVDKQRKPILETNRLSEADQLIVSLCVRRRLLPPQIAGLSNDIPHYAFRLHLDLNPDVRFHDGPGFTGRLTDLDRRIADARESTNTNSLLQLSTNRANLIATSQRELSMQSLYGGILDHPDQIAEDALLEFHLKFDSNAEDSGVELDAARLPCEGLSAPVNVIPTEYSYTTPPTNKPLPWKSGEINVIAGVFDDPLIFPRFFRGNVVGIVAAIPLNRLQRADGIPVAGHPILLWATTHKADGEQSDHVGRSLRTQLPRFGHLNKLHPSKQLAAIIRVHDSPNLMENILATFIAPLEAHRHYDSAPDVMIYDLGKPAQFPNGRWFEDDVSKTLADAGETLLLELSYAESREFPRATKNDKPFRPDFPYLAPRWTAAEISAHSMPGSVMGDFLVPRAQDWDATALPDFTEGVWKSIKAGLLCGLVGAAILAFLAARRVIWKFLIVLVALLGIVAINPIDAANATDMAMRMRQPQMKLIRTTYGTGLIIALGLAALYGAGIRRGLRICKRENVMSLLGDQAEDSADRQYGGLSFNDVRQAVFDEPYYGAVWGERTQTSLPEYPSNFGVLAQGLFSLSRRHLLGSASRRTLHSQADLRWGPNRKGVQRLIHPNGVCLTGVWRITENTNYTGMFATGSEGLILGRYSSGLDIHRGQKRTLALVAKLYPNLDKTKVEKPANIITQADLGAAYPDSIYDAELRNAPEVTAWKRGLDFHSLLLVAFTLFRADQRNNIRQLYPVAELNKEPNQKTICPQFMRLTLDRGQKIGGGDDTSDFRDEVLAQIYDRGNPQPLRPLVFKIETSDEGELVGFINKKLKNTNWREIGSITFSEAVASHNGDFVIHFHHPRWRSDVNDPATVTGPSKFARYINRLFEGIRATLGFFMKRP